jgi:superkiller protein 3
VEAWNNLGVALQQQGKIDDAVAAYEHAVKTVATPSAQLFENLGTAHLRKADMDAARKAFERALTIDPQRPEARRALHILGVARTAPPVN